MMNIKATSKQLIRAVKMTILIVIPIICRGKKLNNTHPKNQLYNILTIMDPML